MIGKFVNGLFGKIVDNAEGILDKVVTTDKERDEAKLALRRLLLEAETEAFKKEVEDRKSARDMYKDDALIQKILATLFTAAYFGLSFMMFRFFVLGDINMGEFEIMKEFYDFIMEKSNVRLYHWKADEFFWKQAIERINNSSINFNSEN